MARQLFDGFSGMLSFEIEGDAEDTIGFLERLRLVSNATSLAGTESLVSRPVNSSHAGMSRHRLAGIGVSDSLVRCSVGIESVEDIIADLRQALEGGR